MQCGTVGRRIGAIAVSTAIALFLLMPATAAKAQVPTPPGEVEELTRRAKSLLLQGYYGFAIASLDDMVSSSRNKHGKKSVEHAANALEAGRLAFDCGANLWAKDFLDEGWKSIPLTQVESKLGLDMLIARGRAESALGLTNKASTILTRALKLAQRLPNKTEADTARVGLHLVEWGLDNDIEEFFARSEGLLAACQAAFQGKPEYASELARTQALQAEYIFRKGDHMAALHSLKSARKSLAARGLRHSVAAMTMTHNMGQIAQAKGRGLPALAAYLIAVKGRQKLVTSFARNSSPADLRDLDRSFHTDVDGLVSLDLEPAGFPKGAKELLQLRRAAANIVLLRKGWIVEAQMKQLAYMDGLGTKQARAVADTLLRAQGRFSNLVVRGPRFHAVWDSVVLRRMGDANRFAERLAARLVLSEAPPAFSYDASLPDKVLEGLPAGAAHLEYVVYRPIKKRRAAHEGYLGERHYAVYLFRRGKMPMAVPLGAASRIDGLIASYRKALSNPSKAPDELARKLDALVMAPVRAHLGDEKTLIVAPDGQLSIVPFAALRDESGRYLVENYSIRYLSSGRELIGRLEAYAPSDAKEIVFMANPRFSREGTTAPVAGSEKSESMLSGVSFPPLPGTMQEGERLHQLLPLSTLISGRDASEERLKSLSSPRILHIATHGFFLSSDQAARNGTRGLKRVTAKDDDKGSRSILTGPSNIEPLLRSGLALALANETRSDMEKAGKGLEAQGRDDGVLTALEASGLDLEGTELVVLSACETGLGEVRNGDGVYGLRRALAIAGARTQVMSLWKVDDAATRDLMISFYEGIEKDEGRAESLRRAQLSMLKSHERRHPFYWASFIPSGEDRSLSGVEPTLVDPAQVEPWTGSSAEEPTSRGHGPVRTPAIVAPAKKGCACEVGASTGGPWGGLLSVLLALLAIGRMRKQARSAPGSGTRPSV